MINKPEPQIRKCLIIHLATTYPTEPQNILDIQDPYKNSNKLIPPPTKLLLDQQQTNPATYLIKNNPLPATK